MSAGIALYSPRLEIIASVLGAARRSSPRHQSRDRSGEQKTKSYTNVVEACDDLANQHFDLTRCWRRISLQIWTSERGRWLVLVVLVVIGIVTSAFT